MKDGFVQSKRFSVCFMGILRIGFFNCTVEDCFLYYFKFLKVLLELKGFLDDFWHVKILADALGIL